MEEEKEYISAGNLLDQTKTTNIKQKLKTQMWIYNNHTVYFGLYLSVADMNVEIYFYTVYLYKKYITSKQNNILTRATGEG